jgi:chromosome segregation ATPase
VARGDTGRITPTVTAIVAAALPDVPVDATHCPRLGSHPSRGSGTMSGMTDARATKTTSTGEVGPGFDIVLRGYERRQVDEHLAVTTAERRAAAGRVGGLERRVEELTVEFRDAQKRGGEVEPSYAGLGARVEKILRLAEEEATELRAEAVGQAEQVRRAAETAAAQVRAQAEQDGRARREQARQEAAKLLEQARKQAAQVRAEAADEATAKRDEAEGVLEAARAMAAQAAAEFEMSLANRRAHAERDLATRQEAAERHLSETSDQADQLRLEAQKLRDQTERRSRQQLETAQRQAEDLVAEARAKADRARRDAGRELAALTHRRDSINAQLSNVRQMLATLTGAAVPGADPTTVAALDTPGAPAPTPTGRSSTNT